MAKYPFELAMGLQQLIPVQNIYLVETRNGDKKQEHIGRSVCSWSITNNYFFIREKSSQKDARFCRFFAKSYKKFLTSHG